MKEHRDTINRLSIELDDDARNFTVYADRLEKNLKSRKRRLKNAESDGN